MLFTTIFLFFIIFMLYEYSSKQKCPATQTRISQKEEENNKESSSKMNADNTSLCDLVFKEVEIKANESNVNFLPIKHRKNIRFTNKKMIIEYENALKIANRFYLNEISLNPSILDRVAIDCEMVECKKGENRFESQLARVTIVNAKMQCIYDKYVKPLKKVTDYRTRFSGIRPIDLKYGEDFFKVRSEVMNILLGKVVVGHDLKNDFKVLHLTVEPERRRDTRYYRRFKRKNITMSLKNISKYYLDLKIQDGEHNSIDDAKAAMLLYLTYHDIWEEDICLKRSLIHYKNFQNSKLTNDSSEILKAPRKIVPKLNNVFEIADRYFSLNTQIDSDRFNSDIVAIDWETYKVVRYNDEIEDHFEVSIVDSQLKCVYSKCVNCKLKNLLKVKVEVEQILEGKIVVGHDLFENNILNLTIQRQKLRDTRHFPLFFKEIEFKCPMSLKNLLFYFFGIELVFSAEYTQHKYFSEEYAKAAMLLYLAYHENWENKNIQK